MGYCETERQDLKDYHNFQKCFISNGDLYPLCKGKEEKCHDCCLYEDFEEYHSPYPEE